MFIYLLTKTLQSYITPITGYVIVTFLGWNVVRAFQRYVFAIPESRLVSRCFNRYILRITDAFHASNNRYICDNK